MEEKVNVTCYYANVNELHKCSGSVLFSVNGYPFKADYEMNMLSGNVYSLSLQDLPAAWNKAEEVVKDYIKETVRRNFIKVGKVFTEPKDEEE